MILKDTLFYTLAEIKNLQQSCCPYCNEFDWNEGTRISLIACNNCGLNISFNPIWIDTDHLVYRLMNIELTDYDVYLIPDLCKSVELPPRREDIVASHWACFSDDCVFRLPDSGSERNLARVLSKFKQLILLT